MLRFFCGLLLVQIIIAVLVQINPLPNSLEKTLMTGVVILLMSTVVTLWFNTVVTHLTDKRIAAPVSYTHLTLPTKA